MEFAFEKTFVIFDRLVKNNFKIQAELFIVLN